MKRIKKVVVLTLILFTLSAPSCIKERVETNETPQKTEQAENTKAERPFCNITIDWSSYLLYLSLGLNVFVLMLVAFRWRSNISEHKVEAIAKSVYNRRESGKSQYTAGYNHSQLDDKRIENMVSRILDSRVHVIVNNLISQRTTQIEPQKVEVRQRQNTTAENVISNSYIYAGAANRNNNTFYEVTTLPEQGSTIYELKVDGNIAEFSIYKGAYDKVLKDNNFLECACEYQVVGGRKSVSTIKVGIAEMQPDNTWKITKKALVKFE